MRRVLALVMLLAAAGVAVAGLLNVRFRGGLYGLFRTAQRAAVLAGAREMPSLESVHFVVYYPAGSEQAARMVLAAAEEVYWPTVERVGYQAPGRVPVVVHPDRESMREVFGWAEGQSATGVYWAGIIRVLTPDVWVYGWTTAEQAAQFRALNPLAHELTHYLLDYMTEGHYPRWYTEGLAQWVEAEVTGYRWLEPESTLRQPLYSLAELEAEFDRLTNQALAYRQSHLMVRYLDDRCGAGGLRQVNARLARERSLERILAAVCGIAPGALESGWRRWVQEHLEELEAELPGTAAGAVEPRTRRAGDGTATGEEGLVSGGQMGGGSGGTHPGGG